MATPTTQQSDAQEMPSGAHTRRRHVRTRAPAAVLAAVTAIAVAAGTGPASAGGEDRSGRPPGHSTGWPDDRKPRTVITTDGESDDFASLVRYLLYTDDLDTEGIVYTSSRYHWAGDGKGTLFFLPDREYTTPQTSWRWTGTHLVQDAFLRAYAQVYPNLKAHDPGYPRPRELLAAVRVGNIEFEGSMDHDTPGSDLVKGLLLDSDPRPVYLQAWGGTNTIARALKSIEEQYAGTRRWPAVQEKVSGKAVILASGFQDLTYQDYIAPTWPDIRVQDLSDAYGTWGFNCNFDGAGNVRGLPEDRRYFRGDWIRANIQIGPLGSLYRSWLDGQTTVGDPLDIFGDPDLAPSGWCPPMEPYDFLSEGDNVAFMPLLHTGIEAPDKPWLGGWGGRSVQATASPDLWRLARSEKDLAGTVVTYPGWPASGPYTTLRWAGAAQRDFAERIRWTLTPRRQDANHEPRVSIGGRDVVTVSAGSTVRLHGRGEDPDHDPLWFRWWQYREEGTLPGPVTITSPGSAWTRVAVPADAQPGQTISLILQATDDGRFPLSRYARVMLQVRYGDR